MTNTRNVVRQYAAVIIATTVFFVHSAAWACEGCKQQVGMGDGANGSRVVNNVGLGYGISIVMLLLMVVGLLASLGLMMYRNCQLIAAHQRAAFEAEERGEDFGGAMTAGGRA